MPENRLCLKVSLLALRTVLENRLCSKIDLCLKVALLALGTVLENRLCSKIYCARKSTVLENRLCSKIYCARKSTVKVALLFLAFNVPYLTHIIWLTRPTKVCTTMGWFVGRFPQHLIDFLLMLAL